MARRGRAKKFVGKAVSGIFLASLRHQTQSSASYALRRWPISRIHARQALLLVWDQKHNPLKNMES
jgi:hypothetical protein